MKAFDRFIVAILFFLVAIPLSIHFYSVNRYHEFWDEKRVVGLSPEEIVATFGEPDFGTEISNVWVYQKSDKPDAMIVFEDCKAAKVIKLLYRDSDELGPSVEVTNKKDFQQCFGKTKAAKP